MKKNIVCIVLLPKLNAMVRTLKVDNVICVWPANDLSTGDHQSHWKKEDSSGLSYGLLKVIV